MNSAILNTQGDDFNRRGSEKISGREKKEEEKRRRRRGDNSPIVAARAGIVNFKNFWEAACRKRKIEENVSLSLSLSLLTHSTHYLIDF